MEVFYEIGTTGFLTCAAIQGEDRCRDSVSVVNDRVCGAFRIYRASSSISVEGVNLPLDWQDDIDDDGFYGNHMVVYPPGVADQLTDGFP
jgi:hypothetical protein